MMLPPDDAENPPVLLLSVEVLSRVRWAPGFWWALARFGRGERPVEWWVGGAAIWITTPIARDLRDAAFA